MIDDLIAATKALELAAEELGLLMDEFVQEGVDMHGTYSGLETLLAQMESDASEARTAVRMWMGDHEDEDDEDDD